MREALRVILAHAFGQRYELPIPLLVFVLGGALVVVASFVLVVPRAVTPGDTAAPPDVSHLPARPSGWGVGSVGGLGLLVWCGFVGSQNIPENILPELFWLLVWIGVPLSCGLVGNWTTAVNPFAFLAMIADSGRLRRALIADQVPLRWPRWLGWWPAVGLFFLAACGELIFNRSAVIPRTTAFALLGYAVLNLFLGLLFGRSWRQRGELFTVLFDTWGRLGYFRFGAPGRRRFAGGLDVSFEASSSRMAFVLLLLVSVNFDGLLATPRWSQLERSYLGHPAGDSGSLQAFRTVSFLLLAVTIAVVFGLFALASARAGRRAAGRRPPLADLLPSLLPIAFGYLLAHNVQYLLTNGQLMFPLLGNPPGLAGWPVHLPYPFTDSFEPKTHLLPSSVYWYLSVVVIIAVHVIAVVLAHRQLTGRGADERAARRSEYPWVTAMVAYTMLSLWLLAQPLVKDKAGGEQQALAPTGLHSEQVFVAGSRHLA